MSKIRFTVNANSLFPISKLKNLPKEIFSVADRLGHAVITRDNRPAYALIPLKENDNLSERVEFARALAKGNIAVDSSWQEKL
ncbi:MAG: hypothetical protein IJS27_02880 [Ruminococcus sp.]|nr:hypothetical protein [Ruminococcus sp.]MBQ9514835.1 hypothetical protein [Ruminococcus sp.]